MPCGYPQGRDKQWPCGRCYDCLSVKRNQIATRLRMESVLSGEAVFYTLTWDEDHVAKTALKLATFDPKHWDAFQTAIKRELKQLGLPKPRWYGRREYGSRTYRPHIHLVAFGATRWPADLVAKAWKYGHVNTKPITPGRLLYVAKHSFKRMEPLHPMMERDPELLPERTLFSRSPGIGYGFARVAADTLLSNPAVRELIAERGDIPDMDYREAGAQGSAGYNYKQKLREYLGLPRLAADRPYKDYPQATALERAAARRRHAIARQKLRARQSLYRCRVRLPRKRGERV